jgi:3-methyladenine DNA glycosylase/8-oxoguanine DNA glycosylase
MTDDCSSRTLRLNRPLDLRLTLAPTRIGRGDPCTRLSSDRALRATRTPEGPATLHLRVQGDRLDAQAWGPGHRWALDHVPRLVGQHDDGGPPATDPLVADLQRRMAGLRIGATHRVLEALVPAVCGQKVSGYEAKRAYVQVVEEFGERAPGPRELGLLLPPDPQRLASTNHQDLHLLGLERARADVLRRAAARAASIEELVEREPERAEQDMRALTGVSVWAAAVVRTAALGDPDAVPVGDHTLKHLVAWVFTGEPRGTDARMIELLEPFRGQRGRVVRLLKGSGLGPPRQAAR